MMQGERWIIFYTDGSIFCSSNGTPWDAPRTDVQRIASGKASEEADWYNVQAADSYYFEKDLGGWQKSDPQTFMLHLLRARHPLIIFGDMLSDIDWHKTHRQMNKYCELHRDFLIGLTDGFPTKKYL